jgi:hypothetical protein
MRMVGPKEPEKLEQAKRQLAEFFLHGVQARDASSSSEVSWKKEQEKSATKSKAPKR